MSSQTTTLLVALPIALLTGFTMAACASSAPESTGTVRAEGHAAAPEEASRPGGDQTKEELEAEVKALRAEVEKLRTEVEALKEKLARANAESGDADTRSDHTTAKGVPTGKQVINTRADLVEKAGGEGGDWEYEVRCAEGHTPVGIWGASGTVVDSLGLVCRKNKSKDLWRSDQVGGNGGSPYEIMCPDGELIGLHGRAGTVIDNVSPLCSEDGETESAGGKGGKPWELRCPKGKEFAGLAGRYGAVVDSVKLLCQ